MDIHILYFREIDNEILRKNNNKFFQEDFIKELFSSNKKINFIHQDYDAKKDYNSKNIILYCHDLRHYKKYFEKFKKKNYLVIHLFDENLGHDVSLYKNENVKHIFREMIRPALDQKKMSLIIYLNDNNEPLENGTDVYYEWGNFVKSIPFEDNIGFLFILVIKLGMV